MSSLVIVEIKSPRKTDIATTLLINYRFSRLFASTVVTAMLTKSHPLGYDAVQTVLHLQGSPTRDPISYHTRHYELLSSHTATKLNRFTERTCLSLMIFVGRVE